MKKKTKTSIQRALITTIATFVLLAMARGQALATATPIQIQPLVVQFGDVPAQSTSPAQIVTLTNHQSGTLTK